MAALTAVRPAYQVLRVSVVAGSSAERQAFSLEVLDPDWRRVCAGSPVAWDRERAGSPAAWTRED